MAAERHKCVIPKGKKYVYVFSTGVWLAWITPALCRDVPPMEEHIPVLSAVTLWAAALVDIPVCMYFPWKLSIDMVCTIIPAPQPTLLGLENGLFPGFRP